MHDYTGITQTILQAWDSVWGSSTIVELFKFPTATAAANSKRAIRLGLLTNLLNEAARYRVAGTPAG